MNFDYDRDKLMKSISERFADLDDYIERNYVEEMVPAEWECAEEIVPEVPIKPERKARKLFGGAKMASVGAAREDMPMAAASNAMMAQMADMAVRPQKSLEDVIKNLDKSFMELVFTYADERGISDVELQKKACINRKAFSKLKCGTTKRPSKPTALCFALALELSLDETKDLLSRAGLALSPCSKQDVIVQYFIEKEAYDIDAVNEALYLHGEPTIGDVEE